MRAVLLLALLLLSTSIISASCNDGQIGPARAEEIITLRPFSSIDDMIRITGIAEKTLDQIKAQGLACVGNEKTTDKKASDSNSTKKPIENNFLLSQDSNSNYSGSYLGEPEVIILGQMITDEKNNSKDINTGKNSEFLNKDKTAMYGFFAFSVLLGVLLILRNRKKYKNDI